MLDLVQVSDNMTIAAVWCEVWAGVNDDGSVHLLHKSDQNIYILDLVFVSRSSEMDVSEQRQWKIGQSWNLISNF